ncbi:MAG: hypothetical protein QXM86_00170 [Candidatus Bathyarchaeia archaeon]
MGRKEYPSIEAAIEIAKLALIKKDVAKKQIPRFSKKYETVVDYMQSKEFQSSKPEYQRRIIKQALEHPAWTLEEARGHGKPTGNTFKFFDESGNIAGGIQFKNRREESKYASYLNAQKLFLQTGDDSELKKYKKVYFVDKDGNKHKAITEKNLLRRLEEFGELPSGEDIYLK